MCVCVCVCVCVLRPTISRSPLQPPCSTNLTPAPRSLLSSSFCIKEDGPILNPHGGPEQLGDPWKQTRRFLQPCIALIASLVGGCFARNTLAVDARVQVRRWDEREKQRGGKERERERERETERERELLPPTVVVCSMVPRKCVRVLCYCTIIRTQTHMHDPPSLLPPLLSLSSHVSGDDCHAPVR